ncbi:hypothetical protein BaRGS_00034592 [Batillaria attramentaria]|uniref:Uncharacterized protein n=1 Tax=Batillaria attramentaria TaxID=370345 RepID=A0ABD0JGZ2_9CAEN
MTSLNHQHKNIALRHIHLHREALFFEGPTTLTLGLHGLMFLPLQLSQHATSHVTKSATARPNLIATNQLPRQTEKKMSACHEGTSDGTKFVDRILRTFVSSGNGVTDVLVYVSVGATLYNRFH